VNAQDHQVLSTTPSIFLATPAKFENFTDHSLGNPGFHLFVTRTVARLERHRELDVRPVARLNDRIARVEVGRQWLLAEEADRAVLDTGENHLLVTIEPARTDHDKLRLLALKHRAIVFVRV